MWSIGTANISWTSWPHRTFSIETSQPLRISKTIFILANSRLRAYFESGRAESSCKLIFWLIFWMVTIVKVRWNLDKMARRHIFFFTNVMEFKRWVLQVPSKNVKVWLHIFMHRFEHDRKHKNAGHTWQWQVENASWARRREKLWACHSRQDKNSRNQVIPQWIDCDRSSRRHLRCVESSWETSRTTMAMTALMTIK